MEPKYQSIFAFKNLNANQLAVIELLKETAIIFVIIRCLIWGTIEAEMLTSAFTLSLAFSTSISLIMLFYRLWNTPVEKIVIINNHEEVVDNTQEWTTGQQKKITHRIDL